MKNEMNIFEAERLRHKILNDIADENEEELVFQYVCLIIDKSLSLKYKEAEIYECVQGILNGLQKANDKSADNHTLVKLVEFNQQIEEVVTTYLEPEQVADLFTRDKYHCDGSTSGTAIINFMDKEMSSTNPVLKKLKSKRAKITFLILTDAALNDNEQLRENARKKIETNRYWNGYARVLVVFLGHEMYKGTAVALANGNEDNVIAIEDAQAVLLSPALVEATLTMTDGTHVNSTDERTFTQIIEEEHERHAEGEKSAEEQVDDDLLKTFEKLIQGLQ